jgi:hypothetical protein
MAKRKRQFWQTPNEWTYGNDSPVWLKPRRHVFFIYKVLDNGDREYLNDKRGRLRTWRTREAVIKALRKLVTP